MRTSRWLRLLILSSLVTGLLGCDSQEEKVSSHAEGCSTTEKSSCAPSSRSSAKAKLADLLIEEPAYNTELHKAAAKGNKRMLQLLLTAGADINFKRENGAPVLFSAIENRHFHVVQALLDSKAELQERDSRKQTALHIAVQQGDEKILKYILEKGAEIHAQDQQGDTPLLCATRDGKLALAQILIAAGADLNQNNNEGETPATAAARIPNADLIICIIKNGGDKEHKNKQGKSPLFIGIENDCLDVVKTLIQAGADVNDKAPNGEPLLLYATLKRKVAMVEALLAAGARTDVKDAQGRSLLHHATSAALVKLFTAAGVNPNAVDNEGYTPLMQAARLSQRDIVQALLDAKADPNKTIGSKGNRINALNLAQDFGIQTLLKQAGARKLISLDTAVETLRDRRLINDADSADTAHSQASRRFIQQYQLYCEGKLQFKDFNFLGEILMLHSMNNSVGLPIECIMAFIENGADLEMLNSGGKSPLCLALENNNWAVALELLAAGADGHKLIPLACDTDANTYPLHYAARKGNMGVVQALLAAKADANAKLPGSGLTPMQLAAQGGYPEIVRALLNAGGKANGVNPYDAANGEIEFVQALIEAGADVNTNSPLKQAVLDGKTEIVKILLEAGAHTDDASLLYHSAKEGKTDIARYLLNAGMNVCYTTEDPDILNRPMSPMAIALKNRHMDIVQMIVATGRDNSQASLSWAVESEEPDVCQAILKAGIDPNSSSLICPRQSPVLTKAVESGNLNTVKVLLNAGADPSYTKKGIHSTVPPLLTAITGKKTEIAIALIRAGATVKDSNGTESKALEIALRSDNLEVFTELLAAGAHRDLGSNFMFYHFFCPLFEKSKSDFTKAYLEHNGAVEMTDSHGRTPLVYAVLSQDAASVQLLLKKAATPHIKLKVSDFYTTPFSSLPPQRFKYSDTVSLLHVAATLDNIEIVKALLEAGADPCFKVVTTSKTNGSPCTVYPHDVAKINTIRDLLIQASKQKGGEL